MQQENSAGEDLAEVKQKSWEDEGTRQRKDQVISELPLIFCWYRLLVRGGEIRAASQEPPTASIVWHVVRSDFYARHTDSDMVTDKIKFREARSFSTDRQANFNFSQLRDLLPSTSEVSINPADLRQMVVCTTCADKQFTIRDFTGKFSKTYTHFNTN